MHQTKGLFTTEQNGISKHQTIQTAAHHKTTEMNKSNTLEPKTKSKRSISERAKTAAAPFPCRFMILLVNRWMQSHYTSEYIHTQSHIYLHSHSHVCTYLNVPIYTCTHYKCCVHLKISRKAVFLTLQQPLIIEQSQKTW